MKDAIIENTAASAQPEQKDAKQVQQKDIISTRTKTALIKLVMEKKVSMKEACRMLDIKYTTGKTYLHRFRKNGIFERRKTVQMPVECEH